jgi:hypothetical protein
MARRATAVCIGLVAMAAIPAAAQPAPEIWAPASRPAQAVTGKVTFTPTEITFQNGKSLLLARNGQMLFRPEAKAKKVLADLYKVTAPDSPVLENGNSLCKGKPVAYLLAWKSETAGKPGDNRVLAPFSGQKLTPGSPDDCGRFIYDVAATRP